MILSGWEAVFFWVFSIAAIFAGLLTVMARNTIHSALFLISSLVSIAALFILLHAEFIAGVQILVYVGGVMVLFLFVIMLVNVGSEERGSEEIFNRPRQVTTSVIFCALLIAGLIYAVNMGYEGFLKRDSLKIEAANAQAQQREAVFNKSATGASRITDDTGRIGGKLYRYGSLPFEIASVLLLVAIVGSVMLARTLKQEAAVDDVDPGVLQKEAAREPELADVRSETAA
ncbi:MAG TPA: NADH-quinone oxidoreductase subunit J [Pyrinomonadaceae bacterium]|nr:NADH-quinone oxidoreductase subunit J [Pyrinomonadaceae bacterium]